SGTATPSRDSSASLATASVGQACSRSHLRALGVSSRAANSRVIFWISRWTSVSSKFIGSPRCPKRLSAPAVGGLSLLQEGGHALLLILGAEAHGEGLALQLQAG